MNAEMNEAMNEDYRVGAPVFDDESSFENDYEVESVKSHDATLPEPVAEPVEKPSEIVPIDRQHAEQQAKQAREALAKFYEPQAQTPMVEGESGPPDPTQDIIGYMSWMGKKLQEQDAYIRAQQDVQRQAIESHEFNGHLNQFLESSVASIKEKYSDFDAAADFLYETRAKQLNAWSSVYPNYAQKSTIDAIIGDELRTIVATCAQKGVNPAEELYRIAQNLGYQNQAVQANNQVAALQSRQNSARTLTASGGGGMTGPMTKDTLANMSEKEFNAWISNPKNEARFYEIMGADPD
ncbi:hypothetical protein [Bartonella rattimassiliensis]|uniref:hypothetical protein n=1 Tax=Bartonella rattimassiliensis TaxID=270250 RepID=UPI000370F84E|nr:hypothetical protein [Bartonella rattimassiliensis]